MPLCVREDNVGAVLTGVVAPIVERADLLDEPAVQRLVTAAAATESEQLRRRIKQVLTVRAAQHQVQPFNEASPRATPFADTDRRVRRRPYSPILSMGDEEISKYKGAGAASS